MVRYTCAEVVLRHRDWRQGAWGGGPRRWYRLPGGDRPSAAIGSLVAVPPDADHPEGNLGWIINRALYAPVPPAGTITRIIPPREWDALGFRHGLFYPEPLQEKCDHE